MKKTLTIATRGSKLALWQAEHIKALLEKRHAGLECVLKIIKTTGDKILDVPLAKIGGKGLFVKEIESALLSGEADLAVHSMKDVPMELPAGLRIFSACKAESPCDALVSFKYSSIDDLPEGAAVGTSSLRRKLQLLDVRPDLKISDLRGNVQTRMKKLEDGAYDAIILAYAGLTRLGLAEAVKQVIPSGVMLSASCQGILGIEIRSGDDETKALVEFLTDPETETRMLCERAFLRKLQGGCQVPIGCHCELTGNGRMTAVGLLFNLSGSEKILKSMSGPADDPEKLGRDLADEVLESGGDKILKEIYS